jgi:hypothetical protein
MRARAALQGPRSLRTDLRPNITGPIECLIELGNEANIEMIDREALALAFPFARGFQRTATSQLKDNRDEDKRGSVLGCKKTPAAAASVSSPFSTEGRRTHE